MDKLVGENIGGGAHWNVKRITLNGDKKNTLIQKFPKKGDSERINKNIEKYKMVNSSGLPTLSFFQKKHINGTEYIETEDLNPVIGDGYFVSPNTVSQAPSYASELLNLLEQNQDTPSHEICLDKFDFNKYLSNPELIEQDIDKLRNNRILIGAEEKLYKKKIRKIRELKDFLRLSMAEMKLAAKHQLELYPDAFFFRVRNSTHEIEYKIADFDCIICHKDYTDIDNKLYNTNISYLITAMKEYIEYFVLETKKEEYYTIIKSIRN